MTACETDYIPALAKVPSSLFGIALVTVDGQAYTVGDVDALFSLRRSRRSSPWPR